MQMKAKLCRPIRGLLILGSTVRVPWDLPLVYHTNQHIESLLTAGGYGQFKEIGEGGLGVIGLREKNI